MLFSGMGGGVEACTNSIFITSTQLAQIAVSLMAQTSGNMVVHFDSEIPLIVRRAEKIWLNTFADLWAVDDQMPDLPGLERVSIDYAQALQAPWVVHK